MAITHEERAARREEIVAHVRKHRDIAEAARAFGVSVGTVRMACYAAGLRTMPPKRREKLERKAILQMVRGGSTIESAAIEYGWTPRDVKLLIAESTPLPKPEAPPHVNTLRLLARLINTPDKLERIASDLGVSPQRVHQVGVEARKAGIILHPSRPR